VARHRRGWLLALIVGLGALAFWLGTLLHRPAPRPLLPPLPPRALVVAYLKVGHGEASWVKTADGRFLVIGAGPPGAGSHVAETLRAAGAKQIDLLVLPYAYSEALGGASELIAQFPIKAALEVGGDPVNQRQRELRAALFQRRIPIQVARAGHAFELGSGGRLDILFPHEPFVTRTPVAPNNAVVLRLTWGTTHFLWEGGLEEAGEQAFLGLGQELTADVLRVARFGNAGASSPELLRQVQPRFVVVSADDKDGELPATVTLERLAATGASLLRTDQLPGDIFFFSDGTTVDLVR
jgi:competence protein ComEC